MTEDPSPPMSTRSTAPLSGIPRPKHDVSEDNISTAGKEFIKIVGPENVISSFEERRARAHTPWSSADLSHTPALVVLPGTTANVSDIMKICSRQCIPVTSYSGGTSMSGVLAATRGGICIDFKRMDKVLAVHAEDMDVLVQPAVGWQDLNALLAKQDLYFPPDPGPGARIGGMVSRPCCIGSSGIELLIKWLDCNRVFGNERLPIWNYERLGGINDYRTCRWHYC